MNRTQARAWEDRKLKKKTKRGQYIGCTHKGLEMKSHNGSKKAGLSVKAKKERKEEKKEKESSECNAQGTSGIS